MSRAVLLREIAMSKVLFCTAICLGVLLLISQLSPRSAVNASPIEPFPPQCDGNDECGVPDGNSSSCVSHACNDCGAQIADRCPGTKKVGQPAPTNTTSPFDFCSESQFVPCYTTYVCTGEHAGKLCPLAGCESISNPEPYTSSSAWAWVLTETECK